MSFNGRLKLMSSRTGYR